MSVVYHYTDPRGMFGIVDRRELWATDLRFLNDVSELEYGLTLAKSSITELAEKAGVSQRRLLTLVSQALDLSGSGPLSKPRYAVSFAGHDLITQWRSYAALGYGYALGFDLDELRQRAPCEPAVYDTKQIQSKLERVLRTLLSTNGERPLEGKTRGSAARAIAQKCIDIALFAKHPAFADEREIRLVIEGGDAQYRVRGSEVIPYTRLDMSDETDSFVRGLREVVVGPLASDRAMEGLREMLRSTGHPDVEVARSTVPYRG